MKAKKPSPWATIKVPRTTYESAKKILEQVSTKGWASIGSTRSDAPTLGGVYAEVFARGCKTSRSAS
jgi:hypothetical protein